MYEWSRKAEIVPLFFVQAKTSWLSLLLVVQVVQYRDKFFAKDTRVIYDYVCKYGCHFFVWNGRRSLAWDEFLLFRKITLVPPSYFRSLNKAETLSLSNLIASLYATWNDIDKYDEGIISLFWTGMPIANFFCFWQSFFYSSVPGLHIPLVFLRWT